MCLLKGENMSIEKNYGMYQLVCDICCEPAQGEFGNFSDAVEYKKKNGWRSVHNGLDWRDDCPDCQLAEKSIDRLL